MYVYIERDTHIHTYIKTKRRVLGFCVDISRLINEIKKLKTFEKNIATNDTKKLVIYNKKWEKAHRAIKI